MKLFYSPSSPYVRKVRATAIEAGLLDQIECVAAEVSPVKRNTELGAHNPLAKLPTLVTDDGLALFDSRVICEYLAAQTAAGQALFPAGGAERWQALADQALADGLLDAALLARYESAVRPEALRWPDWRDGQLDKVRASVQAIDARADSLGGRVDIGTLAMACALGYLDFRYADMGWRNDAPRVAAWFAEFGARASIRDTAPPVA